MERTPVVSSVLAEVGYDADASVLEIRLRNGRTYQYYAVPFLVHQGLLEAPSLGRYYNAEIKDRYRYRRVYG